MIKQRIEEEEEATLEEKNGETTRGGAARELEYC